MSGRGGGRGRGGFGRGRGRGGMFGGPSLPPEVDYKELQATTQQPGAQYPAMDVPNMPALNAAESKAVAYQVELLGRLRQSTYWIVEEEQKTLGADIERWSDRFQPKSEASQTLSPEGFNPDFFPASLWDGYFNPTKKQKAVEPKKQKRRKKLNIDSLGIDDKDGEAEMPDGDEEDSEEQADYDVEDFEGDDDYEANYFDNGEADDDDDMNDDGDRRGDDYD